MKGAAVFLENNRMVWNIAHDEDILALHDVSQWSAAEKEQFFIRRHAYYVNYVNANTSVIAEGEQEKAHYLNFFHGNDESKWASNVPAFAAVKYQELWDGIGMRAYNSNHKFKYDFIVAPGANTDLIKLDYEGLESIELVNGDLVLHTSVGEVIEQAPFSYQMNGNLMEEVPSAYVLNGNQLSLVFPEGYDSNRVLTIDPTVIASTLSGTTGVSNYGHCAAFDVEGNIYTGAISFGSGYPTDAGSFQQAFGGGGTDISISRLNPDGTDLLYATYIGGNGGDYPHSLIINNMGELYVYGSTDSNDYPTSAGAYDETQNGGVDIVVTKLNSDGTGIVGSTYIGGDGTDGRNANSVNYGDNYRGEIFLTQTGLPIIASFSESENFPTTPGAYQTTLAGAQDAVGFTLNSNLTSLQWSTFIGGVEDDSGYGVRTGEDGAIYIAGTAGSADFPTTPGAYQTDFLGGGDDWSGAEKDGFIAKFNPAGTALDACTFIATDEIDQCFFIDLDNDENVFVYGQSLGQMPITDDVYSVADGTLFVSKLDNNLSELQVSSMIAPSNFNYGGVPVAFLVDRCDNIYISCYSATTGLETTPDAVYDTGGFYLAAFGFDMTTLEFATYYGANHVDGGTSRFDKNGIVYQGVCSGGGFPTNPGSWAETQGGGWDIGVFKMDFEVSGVNASLTASAEALNGCAPHNVDFNNFSVGNIYEWTFGDDSPVSNEFEPSHEYLDPGTYEVRLISSDSLSCNLADTAYLEIQVSVPTDFIASFNAVLNCEDNSVTTENLTGIDFIDYQWNMGDGTVLEGENVTHIYGEEGDYTITLNAIDNGCDADDETTQDVSIVGTVQAELTSTGNEGCGELEVTFENQSNGQTYVWDFGDGSPVSTEFEPTHTFSPGSYEVQLLAFHPESCNLIDTTYYPVEVGGLQEITPDFDIFQSDCENLIVEANETSIGDGLVFTWNMGDGTELEGSSISHSYDNVGEYEVILTITEPLCDLEDNTSAMVNIQNEVTAVIGNPQLEGCHPYLAEFQNNSAGSIYTWDFGDGSPSVNGLAPEHEYLNPGVYEVTLTVEGVGACEGIDVVTSEVIVNETPFIEALFDAEQTGACESLEISTDNQSVGVDLSYVWLVNGELFFGDNVMNYAFNEPGDYNVQLDISEPVCDATDTYEQTYTVIEAIDFTMPDEIPLCYYEAGITLDSAVPDGATVRWSTEEETPQIYVTEPAEYTIEVTYNNCTDIDGIEVVGIPEADLEKTITTCEGTSTRLEVPYDSSSDIQWCEGEQVEFIYVEEPGSYCYSFRDEYGCVQESFIEVEHIDLESTVYVPNAFTPNNDGINDVFKPEGLDIREFNISVWNRWGDVVFESEEVDDIWDGSYQGSEHYVQDGIYSYVVDFKSTCSAEKVTVKGYVTVLR